MRRAVKVATTLAALTPVAYASWPSTVDGPGAGTTLIVNARVLDGTGRPERNVSVRIADDRIREIGTLRATPGDRVIDAAGLTLAPGFIDTHSHHDRGILE